MNPEHSWDNFTRWLDSLLADHTSAANVWQWTWTRQRDSAQLEAHYHALEERYEQEFAAVRESLRETGDLPWESLSPQAAALLGVRLEVVSLFSFQCGVSAEGARAIIPFPSADYPELLAWFLGDWWREHGALGACQAWITTHWEQPPET